MHYPVPDASFRRLPFVYLLAVLVAGILFQEWFSVPDLRIVLYCFGILLTLSAILLLLRKWQCRFNSLLAASLFSCLFLSGIILDSQEDVTTQKDWLGKGIHQTNHYWAEVTESPEIKPKTIRIMLSTRSGESHNQWHRVSGKILLYLYKGDNMPNISKGDFILLPNKLIKIRNRGNPNEFDYAGYLKRKGYYYQAFLSREEIVIKKAPARIQNRFSQLRRQLLVSLQKNIKDPTTATLTEATLLNERTLLDNELWKAYSITGIAHIIAISGMHVSLFFSIILAFLWWLKPPKLRWIKYLLGLPVIWAYIAITGFPPSAVRAAIMFTIIFVCLYLRKTQNPLNFLAATGFVLLCYHPQWLFDAGIQLSFAAVASIFLFYQPIRGLWTPGNVVTSYLWSAAAVSLAVQILVFPIVVFYFHQFPVWFLVSNIPASVYSLLLMVMGLLIFFLDAVQIPCIWLGDLMAVMTDAFHQIIFFMANHTPVGFRQLYLNTLELWILLVGIICSCLFIFFKKNYWAFLALASSCIITGMFIRGYYHAFRQHKIVVYNTSKKSLIDYFKGRKCFSLGNNVEDPASLQFVLLPSRIANNIQDVAQAEKSEPFKVIEGRKLLVLSNDILNNRSKPFPVDYLILSSQCRFQPEQWKEVFQPKTIILDGSFSIRKAEKWKSLLQENGFQVYCVNSDGAWVFPEEK